MNYFLIKFPFSTLNDRQMVLALHFSTEKPEPYIRALSDDVCFRGMGHEKTQSDNYWYYEGILSGNVITKDDERDDMLSPICSTKTSFNIVCSNFPSWLMDLCSDLLNVKVIIYANDLLKYERWRGFLQANTLNVTYVDDYVVCPLVAIDEISASKYMKFSEYYIGENWCTLLYLFTKFWRRMHTDRFAHAYSAIGLNSMSHLIFSRNVVFHDEDDNEVSDILSECFINLSRYIDDEEKMWIDVFTDVCSYLGVTFSVGACGVQAINDNYILSSLDSGTFSRYDYDLSAGTSTAMPISQFAAINHPSKVGGDLQMTFEPSNYTGSVVVSEAKIPEKHDYLKDENYEIIQSNQGRFAYNLRRWGLQGDDFEHFNKTFSKLLYHKFYYLRQKDEENKFVEFGECRYGQGLKLAQQNLVFYDDIDSCEGLTEPDETCPGSLDFVKFMEGAIPVKLGEFEERSTDEDNSLRNYFMLLNHAWYNMYYHNDGFTMVNPHFNDTVWLTLYPFGEKKELHPANTNYLLLDLGVIFARENMGELKFPNITSSFYDPDSVSLLSMETLFPSVTTDFDYKEEGDFSGYMRNGEPSLTARLSIGNYYWNGSAWNYYNPNDTKPTFEMRVAADTHNLYFSDGTYMQITDNYYFTEGHTKSFGKVYAKDYISLDYAGDGVHPFEGRVKLEILGQVRYQNYPGKKPNSIAYIYITSVDIEFVNEASLKGRDLRHETKQISNSNKEENLKTVNIEMATPFVDGFFDNCLLFNNGSSVQNLQWVTRHGQTWHWTLETELAARYANQYNGRQLFIEFTKEFNAIDDSDIYNPAFTVVGLTESTGVFVPVLRTIDWTAEHVRVKLQEKKY